MKEVDIMFSCCSAPSPHTALIVGANMQLMSTTAAVVVVVVVAVVAVAAAH